MATQTQVIRENGYLRFVTTGVLASLDDVIAYGTLMYDQAVDTGVYRVLLDEKGMEDAAEASTIYEWCENDVVARTAAAGIRIAGVSTKENFEINKVYETMLQNRSYNFRVFLTEEEAVAWLRS